MNIDIRVERPEDYSAVYQVNARAFGREAEAILVERLRQLPDAIPELSLVADHEGQVVGHILFSWAVIRREAEEYPALALAPLAVLPEYQNQGIGAQLVRHGLKACRLLGHGFVIVLGHPNYYPRFGFTPAPPKGILPPFEVPDEVFMVIELQEGALHGVQGVLQYAQPFEDV